jgi:soluble lytic murein transglycosylase-like protein
MKMSFACVRFVVLMVSMLCIAVSADAEPERYDFPKEEPVKFVSPAKPLLADHSTEITETKKINEARRKSIAALLRHYNKKLSEDEAYDYAVFIMQTCEKFELDPFVIAAMVVLESSARSDAVSRGGDYGLMQVRWRVHQKKIRNKYPHIEKAKDMLNPKDNLLVGIEIFSTYYATAKQDVRGALMYYTAGNKRHADKVFALLAKLEESYLNRLRSS